MKNNFIIVGLLLIMCLVFSACQPTPEEEIIIPKDNTEIVVFEAGKDDSETESISLDYDYPYYVGESINIVDGKLDIVLDANVNVPSIDSLPVAKLASDPFTQERADELREYFMQGGQLVSLYIPIKDDYDRWIIEAQQRSQTYTEGGPVPNTDATINRLLKERENAPDEDVPTPITDFSIYSNGAFQGRIMLDGQTLGNLSITEESFTFYMSRPCRMADDYYYDVLAKECFELPKKDIQLSEEDAIESALAHLEKIGIYDMAEVSVQEMYYTASDDIYSDIILGGYQIVFMREFGGMMPIYASDIRESTNDNFDVSPPVNTEKITINIDENKEITMFTWLDPVKVIEVLANDVDILPFEDIMDRLEQFVNLQYGYDDGSICAAKLIKYVYDISLNVNYLPLSNNMTEFMYAPCWSFKYKDCYEYSDEQLEMRASMGAPEMKWDELIDYYFVFSAVDGSSVSLYGSKEMPDLGGGN